MKCRSGPSRAGCSSSTALGDDYDVDDILPAIRGGLSVDGKLYAAPFYGESAMIMYRTDLFEKAGPRPCRNRRPGNSSGGGPQDHRPQPPT
jgi:maltose-binding protein MalE